MSSLWSFIAEPKNSTTVAAVISLIGALLGILVSQSIAKKASYLTSVTAERSKWIDKLRENLAALFGVGGAIVNSNSGPSLQDIEKADRLIALIKMQLNPDGVIDKKIIELLDQVSNALSNNSNEYREIEKLVIRHAQFLLKSEWEVVKYEATGILGKPMWHFRALTRKRKYNKFCNSEKSPQ